MSIEGPPRDANRPPGGQAPASAVGAGPITQQLPLRLGPGPAQSFKTFVAGDNAAALAALRAAAGSLYLWGPAGAGKSHLLCAAWRAAEERGALALRFTASMPTPWRWEDGTQLVLLDACERYDAARQHAAFALFVEAATHGAMVHAAGRLPPVDLPLREDLRTRLGGGLVFALQPLAEAEVAATLRCEAERRGIALADEVIGYLLTRFARDLGSLMALLDALDDFSLSHQRAVTVPLLKQMLAQQPGPGKP